MRPDWTTPTWRAWQLSVPATGFTHSDHRHPGSNANRPTVVPPSRTTSTFVLSGVRVSSGESKSRVSTPAMAGSSRRLTVRSSRAWASHCKRTRDAADERHALVVGRVLGEGREAAAARVRVLARAALDDEARDTGERRLGQIAAAVLARVAR